MTVHRSTRFVALAFSGALVVITLATSFIPQQVAFGYGECSAPIKLAAGQNINHPRKVKLVWGEYDLSLCGDGETTKSYHIEVRSPDDTLLVEKTKTRQSKFELPPARQNVQWKKLGYNRQVKFRVRAVSTTGTTSAWSDYYTFNTVVENPRLRIVTTFNDPGKNTSNVKLYWPQISNPSDFAFYRLKVYQYHYVAQPNDKYELHFSELVSKKLKNIAQTEVTLSHLYEWQNLNDETPRDEYLYKAKLFAVYRIDGEKVPSEKYISDFGISYDGQVDYYLEGPDSSQL